MDELIAEIRTDRDTRWRPGCQRTATQSHRLDVYAAERFRGDVPGRHRVVLVVSSCPEAGRTAVNEPASGRRGRGGRRAQQTDRHARHTLDRVCCLQVRSDPILVDKCATGPPTFICKRLWPTGTMDRSPERKHQAA
jgi:hypothetical protein